MKKKEQKPRLYEFRIRYNAEAIHVELDNYHYYNALDAKTALEFHNTMLQKHNLVLQTLSVEKFNPYSKLWEDESEVLNQEV